MPSLHVLFKKEDLDPARLEGKVVIVLDVLFATSTIVHAFGQCIDCIWPAMDAQDARRIASTLQAPLLAGEYLANPLPGFGPATPLALAATGLAGATLVYATTNGTVALNKAVPLLYNALASGEMLPNVTLKWFRTSVEGRQEHFFSTRLTDATIVDIDCQMPHCQDLNKSDFTQLIRVALAYRKIEWEHTVAGTSGADDWRAPLEC